MGLKKRVTALLMAGIMICSIFSVNIFAVGNSNQNMGGLCEHHTEHTPECGYTEASEGTPCGHIHDDACGYVAAEEGTPCSMNCTDENEDGIIDHKEGCEYAPAVEGVSCRHEHDGTCGYSPVVEAKPCTYVCNTCNPQSGDDGQTPGGDVQVQCTCVSLCTEGSINKACPLCGVDGASLALCKGTAEAGCICETPCTEGVVNPECPVCGADGADLTQCKGKAEQENTCTCTVHCTESVVNTNCPVCGAKDADLSACKGEKPVDPVEEVRARIDALLDKAKQEDMSEENKAAVAAEYKSILETITALNDEEKAKIESEKLDELKALVINISGIDHTIVAGTAKLENVQANITKQGDNEYTISYPGVTEDTPLKYQEDFVDQLSRFEFSAEVVNLDGSAPQEQPRSLDLRDTTGNMDYSAVTAAVMDEDGSIPADATIPAGSYLCTMDFSKITSNVQIVKAWKTIGFADGTQTITIHIEVGTEWGDSSIFDDYRIKTVSPDNVTFNLFDYWVDGETAHTHLNEGISDKTLPTCGISSCIGETCKVIEKNNVAGSGYENTGYYNKGINAGHALVFSPAGNKTGGWNFNTNNDRGESEAVFKGGPYYGLVKNTLGGDGYPVLNLDQNEVNQKDGLTFGEQDRPANESLAYLFEPEESDSKKVYTDVKGFLKRDPETGNYKYSSLENFASFDAEHNEFDVYNSWAVHGGDSVQGQFFPFNKAIQVFATDGKGNPETQDGILVPNDANSTNDAFLNPYLGLTMEVTFQQPVGGKISNMGSEKPMSFRFSGDDDVWIFIDGVLVADIGGIHDTETATIDFSTGKVLIDRTERFPKDGETPPDTTKITTIREQFANAGVETALNGDTFADNTVHVLTMFYMERGNEASNLELEFNLQEPQYSTLQKVDQDGEGLEGVSFDLYEADKNWEPVGEKMATLTTGKDGLVNFAQEDANGVEQIIFFKDGQNYLLREVKTLPGYVTQGDIHLTYSAGTATLTVVNKWETGAVGGFKAQLTMTDKLLSAKGEDLTVEAQRGLIIAVPMYNPNNGGMQATEGWIPLYGSTLAGFRAVEMSDTTDEAYRRAVLEAALRQFANPYSEDWSLHWNSELERFEGTLKELPGAVENYTYVDKDEGNVLVAYYLFDPNDGLFNGCQTDEEKCTKLKELTANGNITELATKYQDNLTLLNMNNFNRQFYSDLRVPNKVRDLWVQKKDEAGNPLAGAEFTLYSDADCKMPVAQGVTDENGYISFSIQNKGNNAVVNPGGGLSSKVQYALALNRDETTGEFSEKKLWLKETRPPENYECNETVTEILITDDYLYANAGTTYDNVSVARGLGRLVETMARYASDGVVDITLRDVLATNYKYIGVSDDQGFPSDIKGNDSWMQGPDEPLNLHYGLNTALLDYGLHDGNYPTFEVEEDWYGIGVKQNRGAHDNTNPDDPYYNPTAIDRNLSGTDISALFTGATTIIYKDKESTPGPDPETGTLTVSKTVAGNAGEKMKNWNFTVKLDKELSGQYGDMIFADGKATFTLRHGDRQTATGLPVGIRYTVIETEANQDGYATSATGARGTITEQETVVSFVNTKDDTIPEPKTGNLTVSKTVAGNAGDKAKVWNFTVTLDDTSVSGTYGDMEFAVGVASFTLKHGESKTATGLPVDIAYEVREQQADQDGYTTTSIGEKGKISENGELVSFLNMKNEDKPETKKGNLQVTKYVTGDLGNRSRAFPVEVELSDKTINGQYGDMMFQNGVSKFALRDQESKTAVGLPVGISYVVTETDAYGHSVSYDSRNGTIPEGDTASVAITNHKTSEGGPIEDEINVTVKKVWKLDNGRERTESVTVELLQDGKHYDQVTLSEENDWTHVWQSLRDTYSWCVRETDVPEGFTSIVERNGMTFTITNDDEPNEPDKPIDPTDPGETSEPEKPAVSDEPTDDVPKTGDRTNLGLWLTLLGLSSMGIIITLLHSKYQPKEKRFKK